MTICSISLHNLCSLHKLHDLHRLHLTPRATFQASSHHAKRAHMHVLALLTRRGSRRISTTWKPITAPALSSWAAFVPDTVRLRASIHVEGRWMYVSFVAA